eukprot:6204827-Pleurochrysis_carterae.AAC.1
MIGCPSPTVLELAAILVLAMTCLDEEQYHAATASTLSRVSACVRACVRACACSSRRAGPIRVAILAGLPARRAKIRHERGWDAENSTEFGESNSEPDCRLERSTPPKTLLKRRSKELDQFIHSCLPSSHHETYEDGERSIAVCNDCRRTSSPSRPRFDFIAARSYLAYPLSATMQAESGPMIDNFCSNSNNI